MTFKMNKAQLELFNNLHHRNVVLKARQLGISTFTLLLFLDECLFRSGRHAAIVADKLDNAQKLFRKIAFAWDHLDPDIKSFLGLKLTSDSKTFMEFSNGVSRSSIQVSLTLHSGTFQLVHLSEYGPLCSKFPDKAEEVKKSGLPTVPVHGLVIIESTAEGEGNDFHDIVLTAKRRAALGLHLSPLDYRYFFFPWYWDPQYALDLPSDSALEEIPKDMQNYLTILDRKVSPPLTKQQKYWYIKKKEELKKHDLMKEQFPSTDGEAFLSTGNAMFNGEIIEAKLKMETREPVETINDVLIFSTYKSSHVYGLGADVGAGLGAHSSTIVVIDFTAGEVVATFASNDIPPDLFAHKIAYVGRLFGVCIVAPENNNMGHTTVTTLRDIPYPNIYQTVLAGYVEDKVTTRLGWSTNAGSKPKMMYELSQAFEEGLLKVPDPQILNEAKAYKKEHSQILDKKQITQHQDLLIACAIAWQMRFNATRGQTDPLVVEKIVERREAQRRGVNNYN